MRTLLIRLPVDLPSAPVRALTAAIEQLKNVDRVMLIELTDNEFDQLSARDRKASVHP